MASCFGSFLGVMGVMYVLVSYFHITSVGIPYLYPGGWSENFWELLAEHILGYFGMINWVYNYVKAAFSNPHSDTPDKENKLTDESFKLLIDMNIKERERRKLQEEDVDKDYTPIVENIKEFKDNHGFGLYCERCKKFRYPRAHHCSTCMQCSAWMDHHCQIINNWVGYNNLRYFCNFSFWGSSLCLYYLYFGRWVFVQHLVNINNWLVYIRSPWSFPIIDILTMMWAQLIFGVALMQLIMVTIVMNRMSAGQSGLEHSKNSNDFTYNLGRDTNWEHAFGRYKSKLWTSNQ